MKLYNIISYIDGNLIVSDSLPLVDAIAQVYPNSSHDQIFNLMSMIWEIPFYEFEPAPQAEFFAIDRYSSDDFFLTVIRYPEDIPQDQRNIINYELTTIVKIFHGEEPPMSHYTDYYADLVYYFATHCPTPEQYNKALKRLNAITKKEH
jgi:hypothetical protein